MPQLISESTQPVKTGPGRVKLTLISPGKGASGTYSAEVLEQAAKDRVWPRGTQSHINHDTPLERMERPEGSLRNLVGVLLEDAYVDGDGALVAETRISSAWRDFVDEFGEFIGASIVASAEVTESKDGPIIERLYPSPFNRVDMVTVAGRGGRIAEVLEAAKSIESRSVVVETTASDIDGYLRMAIRDAHKTEDNYAWMQDYDDTFVYFETHGRMYRQKYALNGVEATLTGDPVEVHRRVEYDAVYQSAEESAPTEPPSNLAGSTNKSMEVTNMAKIEVDEAVHTAAVEASGRVPALEAELEKAKAREAKLTKANNDAKAASVVAEAFAGIEAPKTIARLSEGYKLTEEGKVDEAALKAEAEESAAEWKVANGEGTVRGVGQSSGVTESKTYSADDIVAALNGGK